MSWLRQKFLIDPESFYFHVRLSGEDTARTFWAGRNVQNGYSGVVPLSAFNIDYETWHPIKDGAIYDEAQTVICLKSLSEFWKFFTPRFLRIFPPEATVLLPCSLTVDQRKAWSRAFEKGGFRRLQIKEAALSVVENSDYSSYITVDFIQNLLEVALVENRKITDYQIFFPGINCIVEKFFAEKYERNIHCARGTGLLLIGKVCGERTIFDSLPWYENVDWKEIFSVFSAATAPVVRCIQQLKSRAVRPVSGILIKHESIPLSLAAYLEKHSGISFFITDLLKMPPRIF